MLTDSFALYPFWRLPVSLFSGSRPIALAVFANQTAQYDWASTQFLEQINPLDGFMGNLPGIRQVYPKIVGGTVIARSAATKQSRLAKSGDCFAPSGRSQ
jgi:hypothetical protein